jgi:hypothetical protein
MLSKWIEQSGLRNPIAGLTWGRCEELDEVNSYSFGLYERDELPAEDPIRIIARRRESPGCARGAARSPPPAGSGCAGASRSSRFAKRRDCWLKPLWDIAAVEKVLFSKLEKGCVPFSPRIIRTGLRFVGAVVFPCFGFTVAYLVRRFVSSSTTWIQGLWRLVRELRLGLAPGSAPFFLLSPVVAAPRPNPNRLPFVGAERLLGRNRPQRRYRRRFREPLCHSD